VTTIEPSARCSASAPKLATIARGSNEAASVSLRLGGPRSSLGSIGGTDAMTTLTRRRSLPVSARIAGTLARWAGRSPTSLN
jgi:hypothetical protein